METTPKFKNIADEIPQEYILDMPFFDKKQQKQVSQKFIRFGGLLYLADQIGIYRVQTTCIGWKPNEIRYEAKIVMCPSDEYLEYKGITKDNPCLSLLMEPTVMHATATHENTSAMMHKFLEALAETRAVARALRIVTGCPFTAVDELDKRDLKRMAEEADISVESLEDMIEKEQLQTVQSQNKSVDPFFGKPVLPDNVVGRPNLIKAIKDAVRTNKGANEFVKTYLDNHNAMIVENLTNDNLKEVWEKIKGLCVIGA